MASNNFLSFFGGGTKARELQETRASWERAESAWRASPLAEIDIEELARSIVRDAFADAARTPAPPFLAALTEATEALLEVEAIQAIEIYWSVIDGDIEAAIEFRDMASRRTRWATAFEKMRSVFSARLSIAYRAFADALPDACFTDWKTAERDTFEVPLVDLLDNPAETIEQLIRFPFSDDALSLNLFHALRVALRRNLLAASGITSPENSRDRDFRLVIPTDARGKSARELADLYVAGTPFAALFELPVPFSIPEEVRFEHCHIIGGTGHGKTQLLQRMIYADLVLAEYDHRAVVVIDSQGDLIRKLSRLELFTPHLPGGLGERLVLIDPSDVEYPAALNLFDAHLDRVREYDPADRERVLNGVVELYETFFDALLGAELTARQDVVFRYLARLMLTIPGATIHTLMALMENGRTFTPYMEKLEGASRRFFETEFFSPSFSATKSQILKRLWGVLATPAFERMFSQSENKLDLFEALNSGKIILVNTAKDLLKEEGSQLFGRFFIAMLAQATLERSTILHRDRTPTFVYVDEAHEYFDERIETILGQARKYRVGLTLAHQTLDQLGTRLRSALLTNTSMKCAGGVSAKDARVLAEELHTTPEFIDGMRRRGPKTEFAVWVKHETPSAVRLSVPLGFLERQHVLDDDDYELLLTENRKRYCGTVSTMAHPLPILHEPARAPAVERTNGTAHAATEAPPPAEPPAPIEPQVLQAPPSVEMRPVAESGGRGEETRGLGKGGPKHRYLQGLVKELAEQAGLRATLEAPLKGGGQVDVLLEHGARMVAVEISVTTGIEYEREKLRRCLEAGCVGAALVLAKPKAATRYRATLLEGFADNERERLTVLSPEDVPDFIAALAPPPEPTETVVKGYRVRVSHNALSTGEAKARREALMRIFAESLRGHEQD